MIFLILIFYLISVFKESFFWMLIIFSLFFDLWWIKPFGLTGLQILFFVIFFKLILMIRRPEQRKYRIN